MKNMKSLGFQLIKVFYVTHRQENGDRSFRENNFQLFIGNFGLLLAPLSHLGKKIFPSSSSPST